MRKNLWLSLFILILFHTEMLAQKQSLTITDAVMGLNTNLAPDRISLKSWLPDGNYFSYVSSSDKSKVMLYDCKKMTSNLLFDINQIGLGMVSVTELGSLNWISNNEFIFQNKTFFYNYNLKTKKVTELTELPANAENIALGAKNKIAAFTMGKSVGFTTLPNNDKPTIIAESKSDDITYGQAVSRNEYGIDKGIFISPNENYIAYYMKDETEVKNYPIIDWLKVPAEANIIKYPMAGGPSEIVSLWVYNIKNSTSTALKINAPKYFYITGVSWSPDEKFIYANIMGRDVKSFACNQYDALTGEYLKTLFTESNEKYVEPSNPLYFINTNEFIFQSKRSGYNHLYYYNLNTNQTKQITSGDWQVNSILGIDAKAKTVFFTGSKHSPLEEHTYSTQWDKPNISILDQNPGWHSPSLSPNSKYLIDQYTSESTPFALKIWDINSRKNSTLLVSQDPLKNYNTAHVEPIEIIAEDGTRLYAKLIYADNLDLSVKHPTIVYLYNGPHVQLNKNTFPASGNLWYDYMAAKGYVIFVMDGRGSSNRGQVFEQATYGQLGTVEMNDQMRGIQFLKLQNFVDANRLGIYGWSFGGFMTTNMLLTNPGVFKAGVAGGPVIDWSKYEVMYTERYMSTPEKNPEGYKTANLQLRAKNLKDHLLMVHGALDNVVVWQQSMDFINQCIKEGVQIDYFVYPDHEHNVRGKDRVHLMQKISDYFDLYLKKSE